MSYKPTVRDALIRRLILWIGLGGTAIACMLCALAWLRPVTIETWARAAIASEVKEKVDGAMDAMENNRLVKSAQGVLARNSKEIAEHKAALEQELPSRISLVIESMLHPECPCRARAAAVERDFLNERIYSLEKANAHLTGLIETKYMDVAHALVREVRIFSAANGAVFFMLALTAWLWKRPALQLLAPAALLTGAAALTGSVYLLDQNWLQTILLADYVGLYYLAYLALALAFMADVIFYRARITHIVLGTTLGTIGAALGAGC